MYNIDLKKRLSGMEIDALEEYRGSKIKIKFECKVCKNIWETCPTNIINKNRGCPYCAGNRKLTNEIVDTIIKKKRIPIIRIGQVFGSLKKIEWKCCKCSYLWKACPNNILNVGNCCPNCLNRKKITNEILDEKLKETSIKRIGECLNNTDKITWSCKICNFSWETTPNSIVHQKSKCPQCHDGKNNFNEKVDIIISVRKIKRLENCFRMRKKIKFQCLKCSHVWLSQPSWIISQKSGCPECKTLKNEKLTGIYLENITKINIEKKKKIEAKILNEKKEIIRNKIFVDFYFEYNGVKYIVEYNGLQHYSPIKFKSSMSDDVVEKKFNEQKIRDSWLRKYCDLNNIKLIFIDGRAYKNEEIYTYLSQIFNVIPVA